MPHPQRSSNLARSVIVAARALLMLAIASPAYAQRADPPVVREAQAFMRGYAQDLLAGNRTAVAARYDRTGAFRAGNGEKSFLSFDAITAMYAGAGWSPPLAFEFKDLSYEPIGGDAIVVVGLFLWGFAKDRPPIKGSYSALLHRQDGQLRIRVEDESTAPTPNAAK